MRDRSVVRLGVLVGLAVSLPQCQAPESSTVVFRGTWPTDDPIDPGFDDSPPGLEEAGAEDSGHGDSGTSESGGDEHPLCDPALIKAVADGWIPDVTEINDDGIMVYDVDPKVCEAWSIVGDPLSVGEQLCDRAEAVTGIDPDSLTWTTWEEEGVLHCGCACASEPPVEHGHIWIANSIEGTVSKIDTETLVEVARYRTSHDAAADPSRTSVGLAGHAAIANRSGSVVKVYGHPSQCPDTNLNGVVDTSTGAANVLDWGDDECVAWLAELPGYVSQRPVSWTQDEKVWTSGTDGVVIDVLLLDGETGVVEQEIPIPGVEPSFYGIYGSATDADGNFWGSQLGAGMLVRVDRQTFAVQTWPMPIVGYGMTVDPDGYVWTCSSAGLARFSASTATWTVTTPSPGASGGCMADGSGLLWLANDPLVGIDRQTLAVAQVIDLPQYVHGVGIDFGGRVWGVSMMQPEAYRVSPGSGAIATFTGLVGPYTYSDMTGFALVNAGDTGDPLGGPTCVAGVGCSTGLPGICETGTTVCTGGVQSCVQNQQAAPDEICGNAIDDDCNGQVDDCGCSHDPCLEGEALEDGCSPCVAAICDFDAWCCTWSWDSICVGHVVPICGSINC